MTPRQQYILSEIIETYARTAEPVSSQQLTQKIEVSSTTIRAEMAELERHGYIMHPHTSAGRIPTDKGYRYYVNQLADTGSAEQIAQSSEKSRGAERALTARVTSGGLPERTIRNAV